MKYDSPGAHKWSKGFVNTNALDFDLTRVRADINGSVWLGGRNGAFAFAGCPSFPITSQTVFLAKLDANGNCAAYTKFNGGFAVYGLDVDSVGGPVISGLFIGTINLTGATPTSTYPVGDTFVAKFGAGGNGVWSKRYGANTIGLGAAIDALGDAVLSGTFSGPLDLGLGPVTAIGSDATLIKLAKSRWIDTVGRSVLRAGFRVWRWGGCWRSAESCLCHGPVR